MVEKWPRDEPPRHSDEAYVEINADNGKLLRLDTHPFTAEIMAVKVPAATKFRMPKMELYDGTRDALDSLEHVERYELWMRMHGFNDAIKCRAFCLTLTGLAWTWYRELKSGSISCFQELAEAFVVRFYNRLPSIYLRTIKHEIGESLEDYITRFWDKLLHVDDCSDDFICSSFIMGLHDARLIQALNKTPTTTFSNLLARARNHIAA